MVKVIITRDNTQIKTISISGHSGFKEDGEDIVCAGISSIAFGMINAIEQLCLKACEIIINDNEIKIIVFEENPNLTILLDAMIIQLQCIEERYNKWLSIK